MMPLLPVGCAHFRDRTGLADNGKTASDVRDSNSHLQFGRLRHNLYTNVACAQFMPSYASAVFLGRDAGYCANLCGSGENRTRFVNACKARPVPYLSPPCTPLAAVVSERRGGGYDRHVCSQSVVALPVGFEPTTLVLTARRAYRLRHRRSVGTQGIEPCSAVYKTAALTSVLRANVPHNY